MKSLKNIVLLFIGMMLLAIAFSSCGGGRDVASSPHVSAVHSDTKY